MKYTCSMETVQQNGRFTFFSSKFPSNIYSILFGQMSVYQLSYCLQSLLLLFRSPKTSQQVRKPYGSLLLFNSPWCFLCLFSYFLFTYLWDHFTLFYTPAKYRVSHETWQLVNSVECRLPCTVSDIKGCLQFYLFKKIFCSSIFYFEINFTMIWLLYNIFIIVFDIKQLNKLWKKTF